MIYLYFDQVPGFHFKQVFDYQSPNLCNTNDIFFNFYSFFFIFVRRFDFINYVDAVILTKENNAKRLRSTKAKSEQL